MIEIHVDTNKLWAMHLLAAQHDIRAYLNGVRIEARNDETRMLATNAHIAGWLRHAGVADVQNVCGGPVEFTIPNEIIEAYCKARKGTVNAATVLIDRSTYQLRLWDGTLIPFEPPPGKYPDMARVRPVTAPSGIAAQVNGEYTELMAKVNKLLTGAKFPRSLILQHDGPGQTVRVRFAGYPAFLGIIISMKELKLPEDLGWDWPEPAEVDESEMMADAS